MADRNEHVDMLRAARAKLVSRRRQHAALIAGTDSHFDGVEGRSLREVQEQIEAIDRAIADEGAAKPNVYETRGVRSV